MSVAFRGMSTTYGPTAMHRQNLDIANEMMDEFMPEIEKVSNSIETLSNKLQAAGAPYIVGN